MAIRKGDVVIMKLTSCETIIARYEGFRNSDATHVIKEPLGFDVIDIRKVSAFRSTMWLPLLTDDAANQRLFIKDEHTVLIFPCDEILVDYYKESIALVDEKRKAFADPERYTESEDIDETILHDDHEVEYTSNTAIH